MKRLGSGVGRATFVVYAASMLAIPAAALANHGPTSGHLPPVQQELELVGELEVTGKFGDVVEGQIADLSVFKGYAYLNSWDEPSCTRGGTYIADMTDPSAPEEIGFLPAKAGYYHGEGAHVVSIDTPQFTGDLLAVNDEACSNAETRPPDVPQTAGGFDLYDVTDPENPVTLIQNFGDTTPDGSLEPDPDPARLPNSYHSVFVWQDGPKAYLVGVDNVEFADVDIYDITDPTAPEFIADHDLVALFPQIVEESANNDNIFHHDMVVKRIDGQLRLLSSYWDAGYVQLDVANPAAPIHITDTNFNDPDPLFGFDPPEGNAHQAEYSHDNEFFLAADEDFAPYRAGAFTIDGTEFPAQEVPGGTSAASLPDRTLNGPTYYGGYGCNDSPPIPSRASINPTLDAGEEAIIVLQRGPVDDPADPLAEACFPGEKARNGIAAGWDAVLLTNRHLGSIDEDSAFCGSGDFQGEAIVTLCTTHKGFHEIFGITDGDYSTPVPPGHHPPLGTQGKKVRGESVFDGWGYAHLYDAETSEELDAFAIPEARDERFASGFGDLSIHEFATDPTEDLVYSSYYTGGIRVLSYDREDGLRQRGAWIGENGSNFWGIEQFTTPEGERLIAGSDRDFGLVILRYTGPGAPKPPVADTDSPQTKITKAPDKQTARHKAKFKFRSDEPGSTFKCKLDKRAFKACDSPFKKRVGSGKHRFKVRAIDAAGNPDPTPAKRRWTVE